MGEKTFYVTTAIDYPNGSPHMGHAYEKIVADLYARWARFTGYRVHFLTGTDENGQKLVKAAEEAKQPTLTYVNEQVLHFQRLVQELQITHTDFIRTTEERHTKNCQALWQRLEAKGDIYFGEYEGTYCLQCEAFYTDLQAPDGVCPTHGQGLQIVKEKGFFFRLSKYAARVRAWILDHPHFVCPESARTEMLQRIDKEPVRDLSVSRPNQGWGIAIPGHEDFVMYTWFDALLNYWTALQSDPEKQKFWPAQLHVIGKDITWFHTVIWPAMLMAAELPVPEQVYVHGMVLGEDGRKMSKALGNGVDPKAVIEKFPIESFRYYLLRAIPSGGDGAFVTTDLMKRHNSELANDLGNLVMRVVKMTLKRMGSEIVDPHTPRVFDTEAVAKRVSERMSAREHHRALDELWTFINQVNLFLNEKAPWKIPEGDPAFHAVVFESLRAIEAVAVLLEPFLPTISKKILGSLGAVTSKGVVRIERAFASVETFHLTEPEVLFPKLEMPKG